MPRMLPDGRRLGAHLPLGNGMVKAVDRAHEIGAGALQVFVDNPTAWRRRQDPPAELPAFRERLTRARDRTGRRPRLLPGQPGRDRGGLLRPFRDGPRQRPARGAGLRRSVRQRPRRLAPRVRCGGRHGAAGRRPRACAGRGRRRARRGDGRARELARQRVRAGRRRRRAGGDRRGRRGSRPAGAQDRVLPRHGARLGRRDRRL